jgi:hypothetical protein
MKIRKTLFVGLFILGLFSFTNCKNKSKLNPELASIGLITGDLLLCGDGQFGEVSFSLSCDYAVRDAFDLAVSLLHSIEYAEAEKAFAKVIDVDPECAMAYWGVAMSIYHALWRAPDPEDLEKGLRVLKLAEPLSKTTKEQEYLDAISAYYIDWEKIDHKTRALRMEKKMEGILKLIMMTQRLRYFMPLHLNQPLIRKIKVIRMKEKPVKF